jgi:cation transport regulator ChaB
MTETGPPPYTELIPRPDPSRLTDEAIGRATAQYRRELDGLRELLGERIETAVGERVRALGALQALIEQRLSGMDQATKLLAADLRQVPTAVDGNITALRELMESKLSGMAEAVRLQNQASAGLPVEIRTEIAHLQQLHEERFSSIAQQFSERDIRTDQASKAAKEALDAALQAAKELVNAQGEASSAAAVKSETSFTKQIDQIGTIISTLEKALDARITELKERIDRGEGSQSGAVTQRGDQRASIGTVIAAVATLVAVISFVLVILKK